MRAVRTLRLILGVPVSQLASGAGLSRRELCRVESGIVQPKTTTLEALDAAFEAIIAERLARRSEGRRRGTTQRPSDATQLATPGATEDAG